MKALFPVQLARFCPCGSVVPKGDKCLSLTEETRKELVGVGRIACSMSAEYTALVIIKTAV